MEARVHQGFGVEGEFFYCYHVHPIQRCDGLFHLSATNGTMSAILEFGVPLCGLLFLVFIQDQS